MHHQQPEPLMQGMMEQYFHFVKPNSDPNIQILQQQLRLIRLSNIFPVFCCQTEPMQILDSVPYSYLEEVAHLLQGLTV